MTRRTTEQRRHGATVEFAHALVTACHNRTLHDRDNAHVVEALMSMVLALREADSAGVDMPLQLQFADDAICYDGKALVSPSLQAGQLLQALAARQIAALAFHPDLGVDEANRLLDLLLLDQNRDALLRQHRDRSLRALGIRHVAVTSRSPADPADRYSGLGPVEAPDLRSYQDLAKVLHDNTTAAFRDRTLAVDATASAIERTLLRLDQEPSGLLSLAAQDNVDRFTVGHSVRVALLALQVARAAGADRERLVEVGTAALLHDIGKSKVPQEILFKNGALDEGEWMWMAQHPRLGADILMEQPDLMPSAVGAAFCHHLRADGSGYPLASVPLQPSGISRLVRVCDVFEALTSVRPYKRALSPVEAYAVMCRDACDFDQRWLRLFVRTLGMFPQGSHVELDDGAVARVLRQSDNPAAPVVRLLTGPGGGELLAGAPEEVVIGQPVDGAVRHVRAVHTHERAVEVPADGFAGLDYLTQTAHGACLRRRPRPGGS